MDLSTYRVSDSDRPSSRLRNIKVAGVAGLVTALLASGLLTGNASAAVIQGQSGGTWIWVGTGSKNYSNHTQWVSYITVMTGSYGACPGKLEAWTYHWYAAKAVCGSTATTWYISKWVPSGNAVCGASLNRYGGRDVACIAIRV